MVATTSSLGFTTNAGAILDLTATTSTATVAINRSARLMIHLANFSGSGAAVCFYGSPDQMATWSSALAVIDMDTGIAGSVVTDDGDYLLVAKGYTHIQLRPVSSGTGYASFSLLPIGPAQEVRVVGQAGPGSGFSSSTSISREATSTSSALLLSANPNRAKGYIVQNESTAVMYLLEGAGTVSPTTYTQQVPAGLSWSNDSWTGPVSAALASGTGFAQVTEYLP